MSSKFYTVSVTIEVTDPSRLMEAAHRTCGYDPRNAAELTMAECAQVCVDSFPSSEERFGFQVYESTVEEHD